MDLQRELADDAVRRPLRRWRDGRPALRIQRGQPVGDEVPGVVQRPLLLLRVDDGLGPDRLLQPGWLGQGPSPVPADPHVHQADGHAVRRRRLALRAGLRQRLGLQQRRHRPVQGQLRRGQPQADDQGLRGQGLRRRAADGQLRRRRVGGPGRGRHAVLRLGLHQRRHDRRDDRQGEPHLHHAGRGHGAPDRQRRQGRLVDPELPDRGRQHPPGREDRRTRGRHAGRDRPAAELPRLGERRRGRRDGRLHQGRGHSLARPQLARAPGRDRHARRRTAPAR